MRLKENAVRWLLWLLSKQGNPSIVPWVFKQIRNLFNNQNHRFFNFLVKLNEEDDRGWLPVFFVAHEIGFLINTKTSQVLELLQELSKHDNDMVRQGAAHSWSKLLEYDFERFFIVVEELSEAETYEERQTAALAPVRYFKENQLESDRQKRIIQFWKDYESDPRKGLQNLVQSQILEKITDLN